MPQLGTAAIQPLVESPEVASLPAARELSDAERVKIFETFLGGRVTASFRIEDKVGAVIRNPGDGDYLVQFRDQQVRGAGLDVRTDLGELFHYRYHSNGEFVENQTSSLNKLPAADQGDRIISRL